MRLRVPGNEPKRRAGFPTRQRAEAFSSSVTLTLITYESIKDLPFASEQQLQGTVANLRRLREPSVLSIESVDGTGQT
jgi:hypothetical protein